jgi:hypothetical protein
MKRHAEPLLGVAELPAGTGAGIEEADYLGVDLVDAKADFFKTHAVLLWRQLELAHTLTLTLE